MCPLTQPNNTHSTYLLGYIPQIPEAGLLRVLPKANVTVCVQQHVPRQPGITQLSPLLLLVPRINAEYAAHATS